MESIPKCVFVQKKKEFLFLLIHSLFVYYHLGFSFSTQQLKYHNWHTVSAVVIEMLIKKYRTDTLCPVPRQLGQTRRQATYFWHSAVIVMAWCWLGYRVGSSILITCAVLILTRSQAPARSRKLSGQLEYCARPAHADNAPFIMTPLLKSISYYHILAPRQCNGGCYSNGVAIYLCLGYK